MPAPTMSRDEVVDRLLLAFRDHGYDGASLSVLARATGLGKSSLYHYFPGGKEDMAFAVLERVSGWLTEHALKPLQGEGPPRRRLDRMVEALDGLYAGGKNACVLANLVVGGARHLFQRPLQAAFAAWVEGLAALAVEAGVPKRVARERAEDVVSSIEGALVLSGGLGDVNPFKRALRRVPDLLLGPATSARA